MSSIPAGKIRFFNHSLPALLDGKYRVKVEQTVDVTNIRGNESESIRTYSYDQIFHLQAPRFRFTPADVHAVYPPPSAEGNFVTVMPHIVLRRRTLPWERTIDGLPHSTTQPRPWLALLLFRPGEIAPGDEKTDSVSELVFKTHAPAGIRLPQPQPPLTDAEKALETAEVDNAVPQVTTIDVPLARFLQIVPHMDELPLLAHVRQVNTGDKELLGLVDDGWFSVVLCNRLPAPGANKAHLVSLEGCQDLLAPGATAPVGVTTVRLISLASWSFSAREARGSFADLVNHLSTGLLQVPVPKGIAGMAATNVESATRIRDALNAGYVPLTYRMRQGEVTAAWYRGPLLPVVPERAQRDPFPTAEAGLIYDETTGMFDVSNAVAWQIGRLLALSDTRFTAALGEWRQAGQQILDRMINLAEQARQRNEETIWLRVGQIIAEQDPEVRRAEFFELLQTESSVREMLESLHDTNAELRPLAQKVLDEFLARSTGTVAAVQPPPDPKARLARDIPPVRTDDIDGSGLTFAEEIAKRVMNGASVGARA